MSGADLDALKQRLRAKFPQAWAEAREWDRFYTLKNFSLSFILSIKMV